MPFQGVFPELVGEECAELGVERKRVGLENLSVQVHWQAPQGGQGGQSLHAIIFWLGGKKSVEETTWKCLLENSKAAFMTFLLDIWSANSNT